MKVLKFTTLHEYLERQFYEGFLRLADLQVALGEAEQRVEAKRKLIREARLNFQSYANFSEMVASLEKQVAFREREEQLLAEELEALQKELEPA